jgi:hypothetical protein
MRYFHLGAVVSVLLLFPTIALPRVASSGVFGGYYAPIIQPGAREGICFGVKERLNLTLTGFLEPYFLYVREIDNNKSTSPDAIMSHNGRIASLGANLVIGTSLESSVRPYALMGIGIFQLRPSSHEPERRRFGSNWGTGIEINIARHLLFLDLNAMLQFIDWQGDTFLKTVSLNSGLNWYFNIER